MSTSDGTQAQDLIKIKLLESKVNLMHNRLNDLYEKAKIIADRETRSSEEFVKQTVNLATYYSQFNTYCDEFLSLQLKKDPNYNINFDLWNKFENKYCFVVSIRESIVAKQDLGGTQKLNKSQFIKLPAIDMPSFDGNQENWSVFYEAFKLNIHSNENLNTSQKMQYLIGKLQGKALSVFAGVLPNEKNYFVIWNALEKKYQDKRVLGTFYLNNILNLKLLAPSNSNELNNFIERFASSMSALKELGIDDLTDFIILHIALKKLDMQLVQNFEMSVREKDIPTYTDLIEYIRSHVKILERTGPESKVNNNKNKVSHSFAVVEPKSFDNNRTISNNNKCRKCNRSDHVELFKCEQFNELRPKARFQFVKLNNLCVNCLSDKHKTVKCSSKSDCRICKKRHHTALHFEGTVNNESHSKNEAVTLITRNKHHNDFTTGNLATNVLLSTAQLFAYDIKNNQVTVRCLIDCASQQNLISLNTCNELNLKIIPLNNSVIKSVGSVETPILGHVALTIKSRVSEDKYKISLLVVEKITDKLPTQYVDTKSCEHLLGLNLADENWNVPSDVDILLGAQLFPYIMLGNKVLSKHNTNAPPAIQTVFGYIVMGEIPKCTPDVSWTFGPITNVDLYNALTKFWTMEDMPIKSLMSAEDTECEKMYVESVQRDDSGRYIVSLPFKIDPNNLGNSLSVAQRRYKYLERKFNTSPELHRSYNEVISEYLEKGYIRHEVPSSSNVDEGYFIPHHAVIRKDKATTKTRVVLDASTKTSSGLSLNDILYTGPNLQSNLFTLLIKFRLFAIALTADVKQMYLRIMVTESHRKYQKILYRFHDNEEIGVYQFNSLAFGLNCSPFLAMRTLRKLASDERDRHPKAAEVAINDLYMDDFVYSVNTISEAVTLSTELMAMFKSGGFELVKWSSNSAHLLAQLPESHRATMDFSDNCSILGLKWDPISDCFRFMICPTEEKTICKRSILSTIARLFDVLGLVAPVILYAKLLLQELWLEKVGWDEELPQSIVIRYVKFKEELPMLSNLNLPRYLGVKEDCTINIIAFADASTKAYGCVVYLHVTDKSGNATMNLVCSKSKVAPLKIVSLARLELCAALILSRLVKSIIDTYENRVFINDIFAFSDSKIALSWIHSSPHRWQTFVANRVSEIQENLPAKHFYHIDGVTNPSDCLSRGLLPAQLIDHPLWWHGPPWAANPVSEWPVKSFSPSAQEENTLELKKSHTFTITSIENNSPIYNLALKISSWPKLLRIVVYILRFTRKLSCSTVINSTELNIAEINVLKALQKKYFYADIQLIQKKKLCSSSIRKLNPFVDHNGLLRIGGRLTNANIPYENKHPVLLPRQDHIVDIIIDFYHRVNCHTGAHLLMSIIRQRYWILSGRNLIRKRVHACNFCFKTAPSNIIPPMADLPTARVQEAKAFTHTGVDFAGPINITLSRRRGVKSQKAYICLFICLTTKAIHIELVSDLSTDNFLNAFKRFLSRRGPVSCMYSDNATNFIGAKNCLDDLYKFLEANSTNEVLRNEFNIRRIEWKTIPPRAPHFGGLWESNIKSIKSHLYRVVGTQLLCYEELLTVLTQIEALLNSRPLCLLSSCHYPEALTPAHFLMSSPIQHLPAYDMTKERISLLKRKELLDHLVQSYWKKWHIEYLHSLQMRQKWNSPANNILVGTIVLVHQEDASPLYWPVGVVEEIFPGKDGVVRVALVRTPSGNFKRPVVKLCPLPTQ